MNSIERALSTVPGDVDNNGEFEFGHVVNDDRTKKKVTIDRAYFEKMGLHESERTRTNEEYRHIKREIIKKMRESKVGNANLVMITSSMPNEGKTFTSINLAMSLALEVDKTVLLVDADVVKPSIDIALGLNECEGLVGFLKSDNKPLSDFLVKTDMDNLSILPAGVPDLRTPELFSSVKMERLVNELSSRYPDRIVIFDAPPILSTSESNILSSYVGQILVVVAAGETSANKIKDALAKLDKHKEIGLVLNKKIFSDSSQEYGYY